MEGGSKGGEGEGPGMGRAGIGKGREWEGRGMGRAGKGE